MTSRKLYLISNGVDETSHNGIWLYYEGATLSCHVATSSHVWGIDVKTSLSLSVWYTIEISWNRILGLQLLLNSKTIGSITQSVERQPGTFPTESLSIGSTLNTGVIMRIYQLQLVPLVKSELRRAKITNGLLLSIFKRFKYCDHSDCPLIFDRYFAPVKIKITIVEVCLG